MPTAQKILCLILVFLLVILAGAGTYWWFNNKNLPAVAFLCREQSFDFSPDLMVVSGKLQAVDSQNLILLDKMDKNGRMVSFKLASTVDVIEITSDQQWEKRSLDFLQQKLGQEVSLDLFPAKENSYRIKNIRIGD